MALYSGLSTEDNSPPNGYGNDVEAVSPPGSPSDAGAVPLSWSGGDIAPLPEDGDTSTSYATEEEGPIQALATGALGLPHDGDFALALAHGDVVQEHGFAAASEGRSGARPLLGGDVAGGADGTGRSPIRCGCIAMLLPGLLLGACYYIRSKVEPPPDACGGRERCLNCVQRPLFPIQGWRCAECSAGLHLAGYACAENVCTCSHGQAAIEADCETDGAERCTATCDAGFHFVNESLGDLFRGTCDMNRCQCPKGSAVTGAACDKHGATKCGECISGLHLVENRCEEFFCTCPGGDPVVGEGCDKDGAVICRSCMRGFHLVNDVCQANNCTCRHGSPLTGAACDHDGAEKCGDCHQGFHLVVPGVSEHAVNVTSANQYEVKHGSNAAAKAMRQKVTVDTTDVATQAVLGGGVCHENRCACRGGKAPVGIACPNDRDNKCSACDDSFRQVGELCDPLVAIFNSGSYMHREKGAPQIKDDLHDLHGHVVSIFDDVSPSSWNPEIAALIVPELFVKLSLSSDAATALRNWISRGGHLILCGDYFGHNGRFINGLFNWSVQGVQASDEAPRLRPHPACGAICTGPTTLEPSPQVSCYAEEKLPEGALVAYGEENSACVFTVRYGEGRITHVGFDWYPANHTNWTAALNLVVLDSG